MKSHLLFAFSVLLVPAAFSQDRDTVYVYKDEGVSEESLKQTVSTFKRLLKKYNVKSSTEPLIWEGIRQAQRNNCKKKIDL